MDDTPMLQLRVSDAKMVARILEKACYDQALREEVIRARHVIDSAIAFDERTRATMPVMVGSDDLAAIDDAG